MAAPPAGSVRVYCDAASHDRPVTVVHFHPTRDVPGHWRPWWSTPVVDVDDVVEMLVDDRPLAPGQRSTGGVVRHRWTLPPCRKCGRRASPMRQERLFAALDALAPHTDAVSLALLAATLDRMST